MSVVDVAQRLDKSLFGAVEHPRRVRAAWAFLVLLFVVSFGWHVGDKAQDAVDWIGRYRGDHLGDWSSLRMIGAAFYVPDIAEMLWGALGLAVALPALERRIGSLRAAGLWLVAHVGATLIADVAAIIANDRHTLSTVDAGSSVVMVSSVAALAVLTRSKWAAAFLILGLAIDGATEHDLATIEHLLATAIGAGFVLALRSRVMRVLR